MQKNQNQFSLNQEKIFIREAIAEDFLFLPEESRRMFLDAFEEAYKDEPAFYEYVESTFRKEYMEGEFRKPGNTYWIVHYEGKFAGFARTRYPELPDGIVEGTGYEIKRFYLKSEFHGKGVAQVLMEHCLNEARKVGANVIWLGVWPENAKAIRFYQKFDFVICGDIPFQLGSKVELDWLMKRR